MWWKKPGPWQGLGNVGGEPAPDRISTEPITGFRTWLITFNTQGIGLRSLHRAYYWENPLKAECVPQYGNGEKHRAPDNDCACGIYAQTPDQPLAEWETMRVGRVAATGTISMTGKIMVCQRGYKAEFAFIQSPVVIDVSCAKGDCGGTVTKLQLGKPNESILAWCADHNPTDRDSVTVPSKAWLESICPELQARYGVEFLHWQ